MAMVCLISFEAYSRNPHNLQNLLNLLSFCCLQSMEVFGPHEQILLNVHRCELLDQVDGDLVEGGAIAGQCQTAGAETGLAQAAAYRLRAQLLTLAAQFEEAVRLAPDFGREGVFPCIAAEGECRFDYHGVDRVCPLGAMLLVLGL